MPHLAVLDLNLPKNEGTEVLATLRQTAAFADVPVVITSSSSLPSDRSKTEQYRVERYITKPPDLARFLEIGVISERSSPDMQHPSPFFTVSNRL